MLIKEEKNNDSVLTAMILRAFYVVPFLFFCMEWAAHFVLTPG